VLARKKFMFLDLTLFAIERRDFNILNFESVDFNFKRVYREEKKKILLVTKGDLDLSPVTVAICENPELFRAP